MTGLDMNTEKKKIIFHQPMPNVFRNL